MEALLNSNVLVLNRLWQAVNICSARRALALLFAGHAEVVCAENGAFSTYDFREWRDFSERHPRDDESVHTIRFRIRVPKVLLLLFFDHLPQKEVKFTRHNIFERDSNTCQYCGRQCDRRDLNIDHVIPRDRGGQTVWENVVCSCMPCNTRKGNRTPTEAGMKLRRKPKRPKWRPFLQVSFTRPADESWKHFLDIAYWNVELGEDNPGGFQ
ncbi:MAG: HNH endonuclease [Verrucomicrobia bacterium]|nr:HNH endonuclease [Verrucomicrobiota bacterium]